MKVIVVGAGKVGRKIVEQLSPICDVVVIDRNQEIIDYLNYTYDVIAIRGDGTSPEVLREAGVSEADYVVASTSNDQANIIVCGVAKVFGNPFTIARVKMLEYVELWGRSGKAFGVDLMVSSIPLVAKSIVGIVEYPEIRVIRNLYGKLYVAETIRKPLATNLWFTEVGNRTIVIGTLDVISKEYSRTKPQEIVLVGASSTNILVAKFLESRGYKPKLIEINKIRAEEVAEKLSKTIVLHHDAFDIDFWRQEKLDNADIVVVGLESDEKTLFAAMLAKHLGTKRVMAVVHEGDYLPVFEENEITAVSPENVTAERIIASIMSKNVKGIVSVIPGVEVILMEISPKSKLNGRYVKDLPVTVGPLIRDSKIIIPVEETRIMSGDMVTLIIPEGQVEVIGS